MIHPFDEDDSFSKMEYNHISPNGHFKLKKGDHVQIGMSGYFNHASTSCVQGSCAMTTCDAKYFHGHLVDRL